MLNYDANHFWNKLKIFLVLELASFITYDTSTCYLSAFVLLLVSQVCTCQSSYFSLALFIIVFVSVVHVIVIFVSLKF